MDLMTSKGPSSVTHSDVGDDTTATTATHRRVLIGSALAGAVAAIAAGQSVASAADPANVHRPTSVAVDERELLDFAMRLELTARDLYDAAIEAGGAVEIADTLRDQHAAYAQSFAARTGRSASQRHDDVYDSLVGDFTSSSDQAVVEAAYDLESAAVATHTELIALVGSADAARLIASVLTVEARHCAVLADASGRGSDLTALLENDADPLLPEDLS